MKRVASLVAVFVFFAVLPAPSPSGADPRGDAKSGKAVYLKHCASCHGKSGEGLGFRSSLPNFADSKYMAGKTDQDLFGKISAGGKGTGMPGWSKLLSEQQRWDVLAYIRSLASS